MLCNLTTDFTFFKNIFNLMHINWYLTVDYFRKGVIVKYEEGTVVFKVLTSFALTYSIKI